MGELQRYLHRRALALLNRERRIRQGGSKYLLSTVAALFSKNGLDRPKISAMVDMVFLVFTAFPYLP